MKILNELEKTAKKYWYIDRETAEFLVTLVKGNVLQIGSSNGYSTIWLSTKADKVISIERMEDRYNLALENFKGIDNIDLKFGDAKEIIPILDEKFDFVFIDAQKSEYLTYFKMVLPLLNKNAIVVADNTISHKEKMLDFIEEVKKYNYEHKEIRKGLIIVSFSQVFLNFFLQSSFLSL